MAIAFDNAADVSGTSVANLTTAAWTIAGSDRILIAGILTSGNPPPSVSAVKWGGSGGTDLTFIDSQVYGTFFRIELWYLVAPAAANQTLYASFSGTADECALGGISYTGANQAAPSGQAKAFANSGSLGPATVDVSSAAGEMVADVFSGYAFAAGGGGTFTVDASQSERCNETAIGGHPHFGMSDEGGAATTAMSWTLNTGGNPWGWAVIGVPIEPAGAAPALRRGGSLGLFGVGR